MRHKFGWDLPPGVTNRMIEEQAGAFEEKEIDAKTITILNLLDRAKQHLEVVLNEVKEGTVAEEYLGLAYDKIFRARNLIRTEEK